MKTSALAPQQRRWIQAALPMAQQEARRLATGAQQREELQSAAHEALVRAATQYQAHRGVPFNAFARQRVRWALIDHLRKENRPRRRADRAAQKLERLRSLQELGSSALAPEALGDALRVAQERARVLQTEQRLNELQSTPPELQFPQREATESSRVLTHLLRSVPPSDRRLLHALYREDLSMAQFARREGLSHSTVSRRHARILRSLREHASALLGLGPADDAREDAPD